MSSDRKEITFRNGFGTGSFKMWGTRDLHFYQIEQIKRVRVVRRAEVRQEERLQEARSLILRQLARIGEVPMMTKSQIETLDLNRLEDLGEALSSFTTPIDLNGCLEQLPK